MTKLYNLFNLISFTMVLMLTIIGNAQPAFAASSDAPAEIEIIEEALK